MTYKNVYECDVCRKQESASFLGTTTENPSPSMPRGWREVKLFDDWKPIHICSLECGRKYFNHLIRKRNAGALNSG